MTNKNTLIYGVGINDADYVVQPTIDGIVTACNYYSAWKRMIERCYSEKHIKKRPTYEGCSVCQEWLTFSNFKCWMEKQDWQGKALDKDIIKSGNKVYCPEFCAFVDLATNNFTVDRGNARGRLPIGVCLFRGNGQLQAGCRNPFTNKREYLGLFYCPAQAHLAWKKRKHELALQLAELQDDDRVAAALRLRYA